MAFRKSLVASLIFFSVQSLDMPDPHERQDVYTSMDGFLKFNINNCRSLKQDESDRQENLRKCYRKRVADPAITCPFKKVLQDIFNGMIGSSKETHYDIARKYFTVVKKPSELKSSVQLLYLLMRSDGTFRRAISIEMPSCISLKKILPFF